MEPKKQIHHPWTNEQKQFLKDNYQTMTDKEIGDIIGHTQKSVAAVRRQLNLYYDESWTEQELQFLDDNIDKSIEWLFQHMNRPKNAIYRIRKTRPTYQNRTYLKKEDYLEWESFLQESVDKMTWEQIGDVIGLKAYQAKRLATLFGIRKKPTIVHKDLISFIQKNLDTMTYAQMAKELDVSDAIVIAAAREHGLSKSINLSSEKRKEQDQKLIPILLEHYADLGWKGCADIAGVRPNTMRLCAIRNNLQLPTPKKQEIINYVLAHGAEMTVSEMAKKVGRSEGAVRALLQKNHITPKKPANLDYDEKQIIEYLKENINKSTYQEMEKATGLAAQTLRRKAKDNNIKKNTHVSWSDQDDRVLQENIGKGIEWVADKLNRSPDAVKRHYRFLCRENNIPSKIRIWTETEIQYLITHHNDPYEDTAKALGRPTQGTVTKYAELRKKGMVPYKHGGKKGTNA